MHHAERDACDGRCILCTLLLPVRNFPRLRGTVLVGHGGSQAFTFVNQSSRLLHRLLQLRCGGKLLGRHNLPVLDNPNLNHCQLQKNRVRLRVRSCLRLAFGLKVMSAVTGDPSRRDHAMAARAALGPLLHRLQLRRGSGARICGRARPLVRSDHGALGMNAAARIGRLTANRANGSDPLRGLGLRDADGLHPYPKKGLALARRDRQSAVKLLVIDDRFNHRRKRLARRNRSVQV